MDKIKYVRLEQEDGTYSNSIPLAVDSDYVDIDGNTLTTVINNKANSSDVNADINRLESKILNLANGSPLVANSISEMIDTTKIYVNTTDGNWYYYNGNEWGIGGAYQAIVNDDISNDIENISFDNFKIENNYAEIMNLYKGKSIIFATGASADNAARARTPKFTSKEMKLAVLDSDIYAMMIFHYSGNSSTFTSDYIGHSNDWGNRFYTSSSPYFILVFKRVDGANLTDSDINAIRNALMFYNFTDKTLSIGNTPADSKIVGDNFDKINNKITDLLRGDNSEYINNSMIMYANSSITPSDGANHGNVNNRCRTGRFNRYRADKIIFNTEDYLMRIYYYNAITSSSSYIEDYAGVYDDWNTEFNPRQEYPYFAFVFKRIDDDNMSERDLPLIKKALEMIKLTDDTLSKSYAPADAKVVGDKFKQIISQTVNPNETPTFEWEQGSIWNNSGNPFSSETRIRTKEYIQFYNCNSITINCPEGYKFTYRIYINQTYEKSITPTFFKGEVQIPLRTDYKLKFIIAKEDDSIITPADLPNDFSVIGEESILEETNLNDFIDLLLRNGSKENIKWEQGSISLSDGTSISSNVRVRTKFYQSFDSVKYLYIHCPTNMKFGYRIYLGNGDATFEEASKFLTGMQVIELDQKHLYKFILSFADDSSITPATIPDDFYIVPVYFPIWDTRATGKSVGPYLTNKNNPENIAEMLAVAKTYYDHRNDVISGTSDRTMTYGVEHSVLSAGNVIEGVPQLTREIDCSTYVGLVLRGIEYTNTAYHTQIPKLPKEYLQNENYYWAINPFDYSNINTKADADVKPVRTAGQIGQWMVDQRREIPIDPNFANLEPGDIIFWSRESGGKPLRPHRFNMISHIAICYSKRRPTQEEINAGYPYPYWHEFIEVTSSNPCVQINHVERDWDSPNKLDRNNVNTISLICRPDLGSF